MSFSNLELLPWNQKQKCCQSVSPLNLRLQSQILSATHISTTNSFNTFTAINLNALKAGSVSKMVITGFNPRFSSATVFLASFNCGNTIGTKWSTRDCYKENNQCDIILTLTVIRFARWPSSSKTNTLWHFFSTISSTASSNFACSWTVYTGSRWVSAVSVWDQRSTREDTCLLKMTEVVVQLNTICPWKNAIQLSKILVGSLGLGYFGKSRQWGAACWSHITVSRR